MAIFILPLPDWRANVPVKMSFAKVLLVVGVAVSDQDLLPRAPFSIVLIGPMSTYRYDMRPRLRLSSFAEDLQD